MSLLMRLLQSHTVRGSRHREEVFTSHWMTSDTNFAKVKRIEKNSKEGENKKELVMKP